MATHQAHVLAWRKHLPPYIQHFNFNDVLLLMPLRSLAPFTVSVQPPLIIVTTNGIKTTFYKLRCKVMESLMKINGRLLWWAGGTQVVGRNIMMPNPMLMPCPQKKQDLIVVAPFCSRDSLPHILNIVFCTTQRRTLVWVRMTLELSKVIALVVF